MPEIKPFRIEVSDDDLDDLRQRLARTRWPERECVDVMQLVVSIRGAANGLMAELMEDHIRNHMPRNSKSSEEAADDVIQIVRTYLK